MRINKKLAGLVLGITFLLSACGSNSDSSSTNSPNTSSSSVSSGSTSPTSSLPNGVDFAGFSEQSGRIQFADGTSKSMSFIVANNEETRQQGLMDRLDIGKYDGMLFVADKESEQVFWMKNTLMVLDIVWYDSKGGYASSTRMTPCGDVPDSKCQRYSSTKPALYAVEFMADKQPDLKDSKLILAEN